MRQPQFEWAERTSTTSQSESTMLWDEFSARDNDTDAVESAVAFKTRIQFGMSFGATIAALREHSFGVNVPRLLWSRCQEAPSLSVSRGMMRYLASCMCFLFLLKMSD